MNKEIEQHLELLADEHAKQIWRVEPYGAESDSVKDFKAGAKAAYEIGVLQGRIEVLEEIGNTTLVKILKMELSEMLGRGLK